MFVVYHTVNFYVSNIFIQYSILIIKKNPIQELFLDGIGQSIKSSYF